MKFGYAVRNSIAHTSTVGILEIIFLEGEKWIAWRQYKWRFQSLFRLWRLGTLSEQSEGKLKESHRTARDVAIVVGRHVSPLRDKGWIIHNWGLMRICVGILRGSNWDLFLGCFIILKFFLYDYVKLCEGFLLPRGLRNILV